MADHALYPLRFHPIFKEKLWGGHKIHTVLGKDFSPLANCGETWEISAVKGNVSTVANGALQGTSLTEVIATYGAELLGNRVAEEYGQEFPLLVKFIDANDDLSVQVHPDDQMAEDRHGPGSKGKTEMWYIFQADEGSSLIAGFNQPMDRETFAKAFEEGRVMSVLNREPVKEGDVFFLPAGRVHTIGKGLLLAEIQQTSDHTYRIYDFDRTDAEGNTRELHVEAALAATDYREIDDYQTHYQAETNAATELVDCPYFHTNRIAATKPIDRNYAQVDSFVILVGVGGRCQLKVEGLAGEWSLKMGDAFLIPATLSGIELIPEGEATVLEAWVP